MPDQSDNLPQDDRSKAAVVPSEYIKTLRIKQYSERTVYTYASMLKLFSAYYLPKKLEELTDVEVREYLLYLVDCKKVSQSYQNQSINAIKFYNEKVLMRPTQKYYLQRPKPERKLPNVLSQEEVSLISKQVGNLKHCTVLFVIYSAGLR